MNKRILISVIVIAVVAVVGVLASQYLIPKTQKTPGITTTKTSEVTKGPTTDETANWKTYTNSKYAYSFRYPTNWGLGDRATDQSAKTSNYVTYQKSYSYFLVRVNDYPDYPAMCSTLEDCIKQYNALRRTPGVIKSSIKTSFEGYNAIDQLFEFEIKAPDQPKDLKLEIIREVFFIKGNDFYRIEMNTSGEKNYEKDKPTFDQILSTFTFTK